VRVIVVRPSSKSLSVRLSVETRWDSGAGDAQLHTLRKIAALHINCGTFAVKTRTSDLNYLTITLC
jgi:hypothetical protein